MMSDRRQAERPAGAPILPEIQVVFTSLRATRIALAGARRLADAVSARLTLIVPREVPFGAPLNRPPVAIEFTQAFFERMVAAEGVVARVEVHLCRYRHDFLIRHLPPQSVVVMGMPRVWSWGERRLARTLASRGHHVILLSAARPAVDRSDVPYGARARHANAGTPSEMIAAATSRPTAFGTVLRGPGLTIL